jgi:hypothetical protein
MKHATSGEAAPRGFEDGGADGYGLSLMMPTNG